MILGPDELAEGVVVVRALESGEEMRVPLDRLVEGERLSRDRRDPARSAAALPPHGVGLRLRPSAAGALHRWCAGAAFLAWAVPISTARASWPLGARLPGDPRGSRRSCTSSSRGATTTTTRSTVARGTEYAPPSRTPYPVPVLYRPMADDKALTPRAEDFSAWYNEVVLRAELADYSPVRGCMVIRPYGYRLWELMRDRLDLRFRRRATRTPTSRSSSRSRSWRARRSTWRASRRRRRSSRTPA